MQCAQTNPSSPLPSELYLTFIQVLRMEQKIQQRLNLSYKEIIDFCLQNQIQELSIFGSVLRDDFNAHSDLDFLVVFQPQIKLSLMDIVKIQYQLEDMTGRKVDLIEKRSIIDSYNWLRRQNILNSAQVIYELRGVTNYIPELLNYITPLLPNETN